MTIVEPDNAALGRFFATVVQGPDEPDLSALVKAAAGGMEASADMLDDMASDPVILDMLRLDPANGLRRIAASLRKAVPA